jgi:hypothetical protein
MAHGPDADYLRWVMTKDFPGHVVDICKSALELDQESFSRWLERSYGVQLGRAVQVVSEPVSETMPEPAELEYAASLA